MTTVTPIQDADLDFDNGSFDSATFAAAALANWQSLAAVIDHTLLKPEATREPGEGPMRRGGSLPLCLRHGEPGVGLRRGEVLSGTGVPVGVVIGFPLGASLVSTLCQESTALIRLGVRELDMVIPIGLLKSGDHVAAGNTIRTVAAIAHGHGVLLKVILETALLTVAEKLRGAELAIQAGADFIKTSTGFASGGASAADVALMRGVAGGRCGVKAAGGIRTLADVKSLLEAGANRIGASASVAIVQELGAE